MIKFLLTITLVSFYFCQYGMATTFSYNSDKVMGCFISIEGEIKTGDADKLQVFLNEARQKFRETATSQWDTDEPIDGVFKRICLHSLGGSLEEAIKMAKIIYGEWGMAVGSGKTCESACAVLFMAGSFTPEDDRGILSSRFMHPLAKLGFHSPSLGIEIKDGSYPAQLVKQAYIIALFSIGQLNDIAGYINFPPSLIGQMIATPPDKMMYIDTVGQAARWQISIAPTVEPENFNPLAVINACHNQYLFMAEIITLNGFYTPNHRIRYDYEPTIVQTSDEVSAKLDGFGQEAATVCDVSLLLYDHPDYNLPTAPNSWIGFDNDTVGSEFHPSLFFGASTPIASLVRQNDQKAEFIDIHKRSKDIYTSVGRCLVFAEASVVDNDPCTQNAETQFVKSEYTLSTYIWPSGGKTIVEEFVESRDYKINGIKTDIDYVQSWDNESEFFGVMDQQAKSEAIPDWNAECWLNSKTNNTFCYQEYYQESYKFR